MPTGKAFFTGTATIERRKSNRIFESYQRPDNQKVRGIQTVHNDRTSRGNSFTRHI